MESNPFHSECSTGQHDWCGCSWCYVHSNCPGSIKSDVYRHGHWQPCLPKPKNTKLQDDELDGEWVETSRSESSDSEGRRKIFTIKKWRVNKDGKEEGTIIPHGEDQVAMVLKDRKWKGRHKGEVPKDEIDWHDQGVIWKRLQKNENEDDSDKNAQIERLENEIKQMKHDALNGKWMDESEKEKIYTIDNMEVKRDSDGLTAKIKEKDGLT